MLACKVFITDKLRALNSPAAMNIIERQVINAIIYAGGDPFRVLWMEEETSHETNMPGLLPDGQLGRYRVYFEVPA